MSLTEDGALKMARWIQVSHGKTLGRDTSMAGCGGFSFGKELPRRGRYTRNFSEEEARSIAKGIMMK